MTTEAALVSGADGQPSPSDLAKQMQRLQLELEAVDSQLKTLGLPAGIRGEVGAEAEAEAKGSEAEARSETKKKSRRRKGGKGKRAGDPAPAPVFRQPETAVAVATCLPDALGCRPLLLALPAGALVALAATSRGCRACLSSAACWRKLYAAAFPHELPPTDDDEPSHPMPAEVWRRLYLERLLDGEASVPCFLHTPAEMARATLDPGGMRLIEAYLRRLCQQLASMFGALLQPPEEPGLRESALAECSRLLDACDANAVRAAKMVLRQLQRAGAFGCDGGTLWSFEQERRQLEARYKELAPVQTLYKKFIATAGETISDARCVVDSVAVGSTGGPPAAGGGVPVGASGPSEARPGSSPQPPSLQPVSLRVGGAVEAVREEGDDEWERATITAIDLTDGTVSLAFADRFRVSRVPPSRIRPTERPRPATAGATAGASAGATANALESKAPPPASATSDGADGAAAPLLRKRVRIHGLVGQPHLNGTHGTALSFDGRSGRYAVKPEGGGTRLALRPENLSRADAWGPSAEGEQPPPSAAGRRPSPSPAEAQAHQALFNRLWGEREAKRVAGGEDGADCHERIVDVTDESAA